MLVEIRDVYKSSKALAGYIRRLQKNNKIKRYINDNHYVCFDDEEYFEYKANTKRGRPPKI